MANVTINKTKIEKQKGVVILPIRDYLELLKDAAPTIQLSGAAARQLDRLVEEGLKEHKAGKTKTIKSLADLR